MLSLSVGQWKVLAYIFIALRSILPFLIFLEPFWIAGVLFWLDAFDNPVFLNSKIFSKKAYQYLDKGLDLLYLSALFVVSLNWGYQILSILFIYRLIGFTLVLITKKRWLFFIFMNFFEPTYWIVAYIETKDHAFINIVNDNLVLVGVIIFVYKFLNEMYVHILKLESVFYKLHLVKKEIKN